MSKFPIRLRKLREENGWYQKDVASKLGITVSAYGYYEQGKREASYETLTKLAEIFDTSVDYLLGRTEERHPLGYDPDQVDALFLSRRGKKGERADYLEDLSEADRKLIESLLRKAADIVAKEEKEKEDNNNE
jgi:transcriptional regulator with XRE-family HTH domain